MSLTGLPRQLEEAFLRQIREEEFRARRALRVLEDQQKTIRDLQQMNKQRTTPHPQILASQSQKPKFHVRADYVNDDLVELMEQTSFLLDEPNSDPSIDFKLDNLSDDESNFDFLSGNDDYQNDERAFSSHPQKQSPPNDLTKIQKEMLHTKDILLSSKRKIEDLEPLVQDLKGSNSEVNLLVAEIASWRSTIGHALEKLETVNGVVSDDDRIWKTALRFFTPSETMYFLSSHSETTKSSLPKFCEKNRNDDAITACLNNNGENQSTVKKSPAKD